MGCISSKTDINDLHPNIFQVMNVDDLGNRLSPGQLEITETDLVLYQRKKTPIKWPLRSLRRYGFDAEIFSFESGRRCPTGPGIYAFRCARAEQLFNLLQAHIQVRNSSDDAVSRDIPVSNNPGPTVPSRLEGSYLDAITRSGSRSCAPGSIRLITQNGSGPIRLGSVGSSSNGPLSPQGTTSPSPPPSQVTIPPTPSSINPSSYYANEEIFMSTGPDTKSWQTLPVTSSVSCSTVSALSIENSTCCKPVSRLSVSSGEGVPIMSVSEQFPEQTPKASYINIDLKNDSLSPTYSLETENYAKLELSEDEQKGHIYMNIIPGPENGVAIPDKSPSVLQSKPSFLTSLSVPNPEPNWEINESRHCYANLDPNEIEAMRNNLPKRYSVPDRLPLSSTATTPQSGQTPVNQSCQVHYIVLDLDQSKAETLNGLSQNVTISPTSGSIPPESPIKPAEGYATIDFNRTVALSHSVNPNMNNDCEGSRKTRHSSNASNLSLLPTRHSRNIIFSDVDSSRKTRHNSTITPSNDLKAPPIRHSSSD